MRFLISSTIIFLMLNVSFAQVSINTTGSAPDSSAMLDIQSSTGGVLIPRMTSAQRELIASPATGLLVFDLDVNSFWFYNGAQWQDLSQNNVPDRISDSDGDTEVLVEESADSDEIHFRAAGVDAMVIDSAGRIGIATDEPEARLHVSMGYDTASILFNEYYIPLGSGAPNHASGWQSMQTYQSGSLSFVELRFKNTTEEKHIVIYDGIGTSGTVLATSSATPPGTQDVWVEFPISPFTVEEGQFITIAMDDIHGWFASSITNTGDELSSFGSTITFNRRVKGNILLPGVQISDQGLQINDYVLPRYDGAEGDVMISDGMGSVAWGSNQDNDADATNELQSIADVLGVGSDANGADMSNLGVISADSFIGNGSLLTNINVNDADANPSNELQTMSRIGENVVLSQSGGSVSIVDGDGDSANEIQDLRGVILQNNDAGYTSIVHLGTVEAQNFVGNGSGLTNININDADADPTNELQSLSQVLAESADAGGSNIFNIDTVRANAYVGDGSQLTGINLSKVLGEGNDAGGTDMLNLGKVTADTVELNSINGFTLPLTNGLPGQRLMTDGSGVLNWTDTGDNFGDHTATQNVSLDHHWLSGDGDDEGLLIDSLGNVGIGLNNPSTILEIQDLGPELRLTDGQYDASQTGYRMGKLGWYSRDVSFISDYEEIASIEVVNTNNTATPDAKIVFNTFDHPAGFPTEPHTPLTLNPDGSAEFGGDVRLGSNAEYRPAVAELKLTIACGAIKFDGTLFDVPNTGIASVTHTSTGEYKVFFEVGTYEFTPVVNVTAVTGGSDSAAIVSVGPDSATIRTRNVIGDLVDIGFTLTAIGQSTY